MWQHEMKNNASISRMMSTDTAEGFTLSISARETNHGKGDNTHFLKQSEVWIQLQEKLLAVPILHQLAEKNQVQFNPSTSWVVKGT